MTQRFWSASLIIMLIHLSSSIRCAFGSTPSNNVQTDFSNTLLPIPATLSVPSGQSLLLKAAAKGSQIYVCKVTKPKTSYEWTLKAPSADLFNEQGQRLGRHYAGPTWQVNRSKVVGVVSAKETAPRANAIPWLLLEAKSHAGPGTLSSVNWIQRLDTMGGKAPATGCDETHPNAEVQVPYTALYYFYGAATPSP